LPYILVYFAAGIPQAADLGSNLESGWRCMMLFEATSNPDENCNMVLGIAIATGIITYVQILSSFYISVNESAAYSIVLQALSKFSANIIFGSEALLGKYRDMPGPTIWPSLFIGFVGIAIYRYGKYRGTPEGKDSRLRDDVMGLGSRLKQKWASLTDPSPEEDGIKTRSTMTHGEGSSARAIPEAYAPPTWFARVILGGGGAADWEQVERDNPTVYTTNPIVMNKSIGSIEMKDMAHP
jgi:hypothetical protein